MNAIRGRLTYANVVASLALFLALAGGSAFAATQLAKNSVGSKQLKANAVTTAKIKKNAITSAKIKNGAITGSKVNLGTLGTVPVSATTESVRSDAGTLSLGQEKVIFSHGPVSISMKCEVLGATEITSHFYISSSAANTVFTSWRDVGSKLGPGTPEEERELNAPSWASSSGAFAGEPPFDTGGSALAANGQAFNFWIGEGAEKDTNTCWYWITANIIR